MRGEMISRDKKGQFVKGLVPWNSGLIIFEEDIKKNPSIELNKIEEFIK